MTPLKLTAAGLVTAVGTGQDAMLSALRARRHGLRPCNLPGLTPGFVGEARSVEAHRLPPELTAFDCRNNRLANMALCSDGFADAVSGAVEFHGAHRVAVVVGTSTSGVRSCEDAYRERDEGSGRLPDWFDYHRTQDLQSLAWFVSAALGLKGPALTVSIACASSARAFLDASHLIAAGIADAAVVGGADSLCRLTLSGFAALELISPEPCRPCDALRRGISIGEAAGFCLLERADATAGRSGGVALLGAGASSDGHHMSSPRPDGEGAALAMRRALRGAGLEPAEIDAINLHGTGTQANDAAEDAAVASVFGDGALVSSTKGFTGHTMGSCGIVEVIIAKLCLEHAFLPGCLNVERVDPEFRGHVLTRNLDAPIRSMMTNSLGFGGVNASLVLGLL